MNDQVMRAIVRPQLAARVVQALIDAGCGDLWVEECRRVVSGLHEEDVEYSVQIGQKVEPMVRLEAVGRPVEVQRWAGIIGQTGTTHRHGDGVVTVVAVARHFHLSGSPVEPPAESTET